MITITAKFKIRVITVALDNILILFVLFSLINLDITTGNERVAIVSNKEYVGITKE